MAQDILARVAPRETTAGKVDIVASLLATARAEGRAAAIAEVVAWLRTKSRETNPLHTAAAIERAFAAPKAETDLAKAHAFADRLERAETEGGGG